MRCRELSPLLGSFFNKSKRRQRQVKVISKSRERLGARGKTILCGRLLTLRFGLGAKLSQTPGQLQRELHTSQVQSAIFDKVFHLSKLLDVAIGVKAKIALR